MRLPFGVPAVFVLTLASCGSDHSHVSDDGGVDNGVSLDLAPARDLAKPLRDLVVLGPCDTVRQDCVDPANKCTAVADPDDPMMQALITECIPITGMVGRDQTCVREPAATTVASAGHDNCDRGFFCSSNGSLVADFSQRHCRAFCRSDADCSDTPTGRCVGLISADTGLCTPTCTLFAKDCPNGFECSVLVGTFDEKSFVSTCRALGKTAIGMTCMAATDCVAGTTCVDPAGMGGTTKCTPLCDDDHPCVSGACARATGLPKNGGICR